MSVLKLSVANQYIKILENSHDILRLIDAADRDSSTLEEWNKKLNYKPNRIELKKDIYKRLVKYGKYYLD